LQNSRYDAGPSANEHTSTSSMNRLSVMAGFVGTGTQPKVDILASDANPSPVALHGFDKLPESLVANRPSGCFANCAFAKSSAVYLRVISCSPSVWLECFVVD